MPQNNFSKAIEWEIVSLIALATLVTSHSDILISDRQLFLWNGRKRFMTFNMQLR